jgi:hypothetical protein
MSVDGVLGDIPAEACASRSAALRRSVAGLSVDGTVVYLWRETVRRARRIAVMWWFRGLLGPVNECRPSGTLGIPHNGVLRGDRLG